jgi:transcription elongation GreA/GreB family factor
MAIKENLYSFCENYVEDRLKRIKQNIQEIKESLDSETKSSAGDKHETGRAMLQLEREKMGLQLHEAEKMAVILSRISITNRARTVVLGSLVTTSKEEYFLAVSAGEYKNEDESIFCISGGTPIGQLLLGKTIGDVVSHNDEKIRIKKIE